MAVQWTALALVVAVVTAGCGSGVAGSGSQTLLSGTSAALAAAHTFRISIDGTGSEKGQPPSAMRGSGVIDWTTGTADIRITGSDQPGRLVIVGGRLYLHRASSAEDTKTPGPAWLRLPAGHGDALSGLEPLGDPLTTLSSLQSQMSDVADLGMVQLAGESTTELTGHLSRLAGSPATVAVTVWIDQQGRIRQLHFVATGHHQSSNITERFFDFGVPVHVVAPPADQVTSLQRLLNKAFAKLPPPTSFPTPPPGFRHLQQPAGLPHPTGSWTVRATSLTDGISWRLATTTATRGGECLATTTSPALGQITADRGADGSGLSSDLPAPEHLGLHADCGPAPKLNVGNDAPVQPIVQILDADHLGQSGSGRHYISGIANSQVTSLVAQLSDGSTVPVQLHNGVFFATWTGHRRPTGMTFNYPLDPSVTCTADTGDGYDVTDLTCG
jgi:hypothetical protein